jgi:hypothetical protein
MTELCPRCREKRVTSVLSNGLTYIQGIALNRGKDQLMFGCTTLDISCLDIAEEMVLICYPDTMRFSLSECETQKSFFWVQQILEPGNWIKITWTTADALPTPFWPSNFRLSVLMLLTNQNVNLTWSSKFRWAAGRLESPPQDLHVLLSWLGISHIGLFNQHPCVGSCVLHQTFSMKTHVSI